MTLYLSKQLYLRHLLGLSPNFEHSTLAKLSLFSIPLRILTSPLDTEVHNSPV